MRCQPSVRAQYSAAARLRARYSVSFSWISFLLSSPWYRSVMSRWDTSGSVSYTHLDVYKRQGLKDVQEWLGHSDIKMTANIYGHLDIRRKRSIANGLEQALPRLKP